jgi:hypothetical protein
MSERVYAWLLRLYPRAFRERYAQEMMRTFRDRLRHEPTVRLWIDVGAAACRLRGCRAVDACRGVSGGHDGRSGSGDGL